MKKLFLLCLLCFLPIFILAEESPEPVPLVTASYNLRETPRIISEEATLQVLDNGTSQMQLQFKYSPYQYEALPKDAIIRLIKVDGTEGFYGQASIVFHGENGTANCVFSATIPLDRTFGETKFMTVAVCDPDGTEFRRLKYVLKDYDAANGTWPAPESTPEVPTIPPVSPTPTPTPRPTLVPGATEPPQDTAVLTIPFKMREYTDKYTEKGATLRIYEDMSALTVRFQYGKNIPEGTIFRLSTVDGKLGLYGEALISAPDEQGIRQAVLLFNQQVGPLTNINLEAYAPGQQQRLFKAFYKRSGHAPVGWDKMDPIGTIPPVSMTPEPTPSATPNADGTTPAPTEAPTEPPRSQLLNQVRYAQMDSVKWFRLKEARLRRYEGGLCALEVQFTYSGELPAKPLMRIVWREYIEGNFGEAIVTRDAKTDIWTALILTNQLQSSLRAFRLKCYDEKGHELFYADFVASPSGALWAGGYEATIARAMLPTATPEPTETPIPTPTVAATDAPAESPTPAPTEPPYSEARSKRKFLLVDKVKDYAHYNITLRRYADCDVLSVYFRYKGDLPEGSTLRLVRVDHLLDNFGEAAIVPAELKNAAADLLCAKIVSDRIPLNAIGMRTEAVTPDGEVVFTADFYPEVDGFNANNARKLLSSEHPEPSDTPSPTPEVTVVPPQ